MVHAVCAHDVLDHTRQTVVRVGGTGRLLLGLGDGFLEPGQQLGSAVGEDATLDFRAERLAQALQMRLHRGIGSVRDQDLQLRAQGLEFGGRELSQVNLEALGQQLIKRHAALRHGCGGIFDGAECLLQCSRTELALRMDQVAQQITNGPAGVFQRMAVLGVDPHAARGHGVEEPVPSARYAVGHLVPSGAFRLGGKHCCCPRLPMELPDRAVVEHMVGRQRQVSGGGVSDGHGRLSLNVNARKAGSTPGGRRRAAGFRREERRGRLEAADRCWPRWTGGRRSVPAMSPPRR